MDPFSVDFDAKLALEKFLVGPHIQPFDTIQSLEEDLIQYNAELAVALRRYDEELRPKSAVEPKSKASRTNAELRRMRAEQKAEQSKQFMEATGIEYLRGVGFAMAHGGPYDQLREWTRTERRVSVKLRSGNPPTVMNRLMEGVIVAYDVHWNLILRDCDEVYQPPKRIGRRVQTFRFAMPNGLRYQELAPGILKRRLDCSMICATMLRQQVREWREFTYRKNLENKQRRVQEKRDIVKAAAAGEKNLPTHMRKDATKIAEGLVWDSQIDNLDDEYRWAGCEDPRIVITTSHMPSGALKRFVKELRITIPNSQTVNRGGHDVKSIIAAAKTGNMTDVIFVNESRGNPDGMIVCHLPHGPTTYFSMSNVVLRHNLGDKEPMSEQYPHLVFHRLNSKIGLRVTNVLKYLFPVPKPDSKRVVSFQNTDDFISFRQHTYKTGEGGKIELKELGPRFELRPYLIIQGTIDMERECEREWALRSYTNKRKNILSIDEEEPAEEEQPMEE